MAQVAFDPAEFRVLYPQFSTLADAQLNFAFAKASVIVSNKDSSIISDLTVRKIILYLLTAHICALEYGVGGEAPTPLVGRIKSASEGSVSVDTEYATASGSRAWWDQTKWGAEAWAMTAPFRTARYVPSCQPYPGGYRPDGWVWGR